jgi:HlyD family secretion protein
MKKLFTVFVVLALLSIFGGTLYYLYAKSEEPPVVYDTETPFVADIVEKTVATGSVVPRKEVEVKPQVSGIIEEVYVEPGDRVERGDLIAKIEIIPDMVNLNNAENRVERARIAFDNARRDLERNRDLEAEGTISEAAFQDIEEAYENARQELESAQDNLEIIRRGTTRRSAESSNTRVRATISGMVLEVPVEAGDSVIEANTFNDGTTLATVADMSDLIFEGKVDESEVGKLEPGMELELTVGAIESERFEAVLEHIAPKGVEEDGAIQFEIRAAIRAREGHFLRANYSANASIVLDRREQVLAIHESLLHFDDDVAWVEVEAAPQQFERREVELGLSDGITIEVLSGLDPEDRIKNPNTASRG